MVKVNLRDGRTLCFDLTTDVGLAAWCDSSSAPGFQKNITGVSIQYDGWTHALPVPPRFRSIEFEAERIQPHGKLLGESITCTADDVVATLTVYHSGVSRIDIKRREWRQRYAP